jgi:exopolysaccharide production protein ExoQ
VSLAVGFERPVDFHRPFFVALATVFIMNIISAHFTAPIDASMGVNGIYAQKNSAGALALYVIIVASATVVLPGAVLVRLLAAALAIFGWSFLISTHAKTSIATAALLTIGLPFLAHLLPGSTRYKSLVIGFVVTIVALALFGQYICGLSYEQIGQAIFGDLTFTNRTYIWNALYPEIALHPWTGTGFGSFWATGQLLNPISAARPDEFFMDPSVINEAHNGYIDITLQAGYVGLALTLLVILRAIWCLCSTIAQHDTAKDDRYVCVMTLGLVLGLIVANFTESELFSPSNMIGYMFVVIAVQTQRWHLRQRRPPRITDPDAPFISSGVRDPGMNRPIAAAATKSYW